MPPGASGIEDGAPITPSAKMSRARVALISTPRPRLCEVTNIGAFPGHDQNLSPRALWLSRLAAYMRFASIRSIDERDTKCVSGTPQHAALTNATLATMEPQRELVGY